MSAIEDLQKIITDAGALIALLDAQRPGDNPAARTECDQLCLGLRGDPAITSRALKVARLCQATFSPRRGLMWPADNIPTAQSHLRGIQEHAQWLIDTLQKKAT